MSSFQLKSAIFSRDVTARIPAVAFAMILGVAVVYGVGFAPIEAVHNAVHDGRHVFAFPCH